MLKKIKKNRNQKGFTLVELMVVLAIIGILMAIAIPNFIEYRTRGANRTAKTEAANFYHAALAQVADDGQAGSFSSAAAPSGFAVNTDVTYAAGPLVVPVAGFSCSGVPTFTHARGTITYTIGTDGVITP